MAKQTDEMLRQLKQAPSLTEYLEENGPEMVSDTARDQLETLLAETGRTKAEVLRRAEINDIYGYQLFAGSRKPSRDKMVALCVGFGVSLDRTQQALKAAGFAPLYAKNKRDSALIYGIEKGQTVPQINTALYELGEETL